MILNLNKKRFVCMIVSFFILFFSSSLLAIDNLNYQSQYKQQIRSKVLYVKYSKIPKIVYTKQRFTVKILSNILISKKNINYKISTNINNHNSNVTLIKNDIIWNKIDEHHYEASLQFKVKKKSVKLPIITINLYDKKNNIIDRAKLKNPKIIFRNIAINQNKYSNILANTLKIERIKTKQYTNKELIHSISIKAYNSNLEEFHLNGFKSQGIKALNSNNNSQTLYYFVITPRSQKSIIFNYYNTAQNKFIDINIPITVKEELVSTQTDLNPYENNMLIYKKLAISIVALIFLMIYYFKREFFYLFFTILFMTLLIYMMLPNKKKILTKNTKVYILPTYNSTIFKILEKKEEVEVLIKKNKFSKVLFKNNSIGWIKNNG